MNIYGMKFKDILNIKITDLRKYGLSLMVTNNLIQWGYIYNFEQLLKCPEEKLYSISGIDSESVEEIKSIVTFFQIPGIHLGMSKKEINKFLGDQVLLEVEGLSEEYAELEQSEEETSKAELLVDEATKYRDRLLNLNHRKKEALKSLQALFEEQERLQEENRLLDEQIILLKEKLSHIKTKDNKAVDNSGKQKQL